MTRRDALRGLLALGLVAPSSALCAPAQRAAAQLWPPVWFWDSPKAALKRDAVGLWLWTNTGTLGTDFSSQGNTLTNNNSVTAGSGPSGLAAATFVSASSQTLSITDNASLSMPGTSFTITAWINFSTTGTRSVAGKWIAANFEYLLYLNTSHMEMFVNHLGTGGDTQAVSGVTLSTSTWYFVRAWLDLGAGTINILINETNLATAAHTTGTFDGTAPFRIGGDSNPVADFWNGSLGPIGLWKRLLTAREGAYLAAGNTLA